MSSPQAIPKNRNRIKLAAITPEPLAKPEWLEDPKTTADELNWNEDDQPADNYAALGVRLAKCGDLFCSPSYGSGLLMLLPDGKPVHISKGADVAPVIVDRIRVCVWKDGKPKGGKISMAHLNAMLRSNVFRHKFLPVDRITNVPMYLPDFTLTKPGHNDGGPDDRIYYVGDPAEISDSLEFINVFLNVMEFETAADRTNVLAAALTVVFHNHWPGGKPIILVTANKSQAGKDTAIYFASGLFGQCSISYQSTNWALERSFVGALKLNPETAVVVIENARVERWERFMACAFIERFATDPEPLLFSTGTGQPVRRKNDIVVAISTNYGSVSEDILNRSLPIHLTVVGNVADRHPDIGNPKEEFLPQHRSQIAAELRGMIERWRLAGMPLDTNVRHPFSVWAKTIGGILMVNGFTDFLSNYSQRRTADDPLREALGMLGAEWADKDKGRWFRADEWARRIVKLGLTKRAVPPGDQDSKAGRCRGTGVVLSAHRDETFVVKTDGGTLTLRLEKKRRRFDENQPHTRYRFVVDSQESVDESVDEAEE